MPKAVVANLEGLSEQLQAEYKQGEDGRFYLNVDGVDELPAVRGLKSKNTELLDKLAKLKADHEALGVTADELAELRRKAAEANGKGPNAEKVAELEARLAEVRRNAEAEVASAKAEVEKERAANRKAVRDAAIASAIANAGANPKIAKHIEDMFDVRLNDSGAYEVVVVKDGQPRFKGSMGDHMTADDLLAELKGNDEYGIFFPPPGGGGSGAAPTGGTGGTGGRKTWDQLNLTERSKLYQDDPTIRQQVDSGALKLS